MQEKNGGKTVFANSEFLRSVVVIIAAVVGSTGVQYVFPLRADPFTGSQGASLALQLTQLKGDMQLLRLEMEANRKLMKAEIKEVEILKPPTKTRERIEAIEDFLNKLHDYVPPHRRWKE